MNPAHLHLVINHIPVLGSLAVLALIIYAAIGLVRLFKSRDVSRRMILALGLMALLNSGLMLYTANLGGQIMHGEIRKSNSPPETNLQPATPAEKDN